MQGELKLAKSKGISLSSKKWKTYFFVLSTENPSTFQYYKQEGDKDASGSIELLPGTN